VIFAGQARPALLLRAGRGDVLPEVGPRYLGARDIALLQIAPDLTGPAATLCDFHAGRVLGAVREDPAAYAGYAEIAVRLEPCESGAGVFDAAQGCLIGLVSHRDELRPERTRIVLATTLRGFLDEQSAPAGAGVAVPPGRW
jgi:hypothetical protein